MNHNNHAKNRRFIWPAVCGAVALIVLLAVPALKLEPEPSAPPVESIPAEQTAQPQVTEPPEIVIGQGLVIERIDRYSGRYMEDGTNDIVQDVMMLILRNDTEQDLQLARIGVAYPDITAEFEATNLPAGERAVLLERSRQSYTGEEYLEITLDHVVFFPQKMDLMSDVLEIEGSAGMVEATNVSGADLTGPVYIYYKNSAGDLFYGGITYRVRIDDGLAPGETVRIPAGHYHPADCRFVMATSGG